MSNSEYNGNASDWLNRIKDGDPDFVRWLPQYEKQLINVIKRNLDFGPEFHSAFELLMTVFPLFALTLSHTKTWMPLLFDALLPALDVKDRDLQIQVYRWLGESHLHLGKPQLARQSFNNALDHAKERSVKPMVVSAYIGLLHLQWFQFQDELMPAMAKGALDIAHDIGDPELSADLHDVLAYAYMRGSRMADALQHAQMSLVYGWISEDPALIGRGAFTLSATYRNAAVHDKKPHFLQQSRQLLDAAQEWAAGANNAWQYTLFAYEEGMNYFHSKEYDYARQWLRQALEEAQVLGRQHYMAVAYHSLGLLETRTRNFHDAHLNLAAAAGLWGVVKNDAERASALQALGHLENLNNRPELAMDFLQTALSISGELDPNEQIVQLRDRIYETMREIKFPFQEG